MTEKKVRCDFCGAPALPIRYDHVRETDGAGGMETNYKEKDLCHKHMADALQALLEQPPAAPCKTAKEWFSNWIRGAMWKPS